MVWLVTHMWALLGVASVLGFLFGLALRGALLKDKLRQAEVARDLSAAELAEARGEVEAFYAAQRKQAGETDGAGGDALRAELEAREQKLAQLGSELERSRAELAELQAQGRDTAPGAVLGAVAGAGAASIGHAVSDSADGEDDPARTGSDEAADTLDPEAIAWRNRYLESRVRHLEGRLSGKADERVASAGATPDRLRWENDYLRTRIGVFERRTIDRAGEPAPKAGPAEPSGSGGETADEELARLRWRNRYLEGRLAYLEEEVAPMRLAEANAPPVGAEPAEPSQTDTDIAGEAGDTTQGASLDAAPDMADMADATPGITDPGDTAPATVSDHAPASEPARTTPEDTSGGQAAENAPSPAETDTGAKDGGHASVAISADATDDDAPVEPDAQTPTPDLDIQPERPEALTKPRSGGRDELTRIEGIGPRIQEALNSLGVFHFDQIAAWTPAHEAWIDEYLSFSGRVARERWVEQAKGLGAPPSS